MLSLDQVKKILIIRYRFVGDTVLTIPFIKNVKENFPSAKIDVLVSPNSGELLENNPDVNQVIYFNTRCFTNMKVEILHAMLLRQQFTNLF